MGFSYRIRTKNVLLAFLVRILYHPTAWLTNLQIFEVLVNIHQAFQFIGNAQLHF